MAAGGGNALLDDDQLVNYDDLLDFAAGAEIPRQRMIDAIEFVLEENGFTVTFEISRTRRGGRRPRVIVATDRDGTVYTNGINREDSDDEILFRAGDIFNYLMNSSRLAPEE